MSLKRSEIGNILLTLLLTVLIIAAGFGVNFAGKAILKASYPQKYCEAVESCAAEYGIEPALVFAVIKTESNFSADAVSSAGAQGLMQIMPKTADFLDKLAGRTPAERDLLQPETNIRYGCEMLKWLGDEFFATGTVLAAYNAGYGNVRTWLSDSAYSADGVMLHTIPFEETENFVGRVTFAAERYRELYYNGGK